MTTHQIANAKENRISESQLHSIIKESVKEVLGQTGHADGFQNAVLEVMDNIGEYMMDVPLVLIKGRKRAVVKFAGKTEDKIVKNRGLDIHVTQWTIKMGPRYYKTGTTSASLSRTSPPSKPVNPPPALTRWLQ